MSETESEPYKADRDEYKEAIECRNPTVSKLNNSFDRWRNRQHFAVAERPVASAAIPGTSGPHNGTRKNGNNMPDECHPRDSGYPP
jgi:hypothetical protein